MSRTPAPQPSVEPPRPWFIATCNFAVSLAAGGGILASVAGLFALDGFAQGLAFYPVVATVVLCIAVGLCCAIGGAGMLDGDARNARMAAVGTGIFLLPLGGWGALFFADGVGWWLGMLGLAALVAMLMVVNLLAARDLRPAEPSPVIRMSDRS